MSRFKNKTGSVVKECIICKKDFISFKSDNRKYCSRKCYDKSPTRGTRPKNRIIKICEYCGKSFDRPAANFKKHCKHYFCSQECFGNWFNINAPKGKDVYNWSGGYTPEAYKTKWESIKKTIKKRAKFVCEICGKKHKLMDVHHKIPVRLNKDITVINHLDNLLYLCRPCHILEDVKLRGGYPHQKSKVVSGDSQAA